MSMGNVSNVRLSGTRRLSILEDLACWDLQSRTIFAGSGQREEVTQKLGIWLVVGGGGGGGGSDYKLL